MKYLATSIVLFAQLACTSSPHPEGESGYVQKIEKYSAGDKQFAGLYHNFEFRSTLLNSEVVQAINNRSAQMYEWSETEKQEKLQKETNKMKKETRLWLSFFTPDQNDDNLATQKTIWKIYLKTGSHRYEGRAEKANANLSEASALFPYHTRWATAYYLVFPVSTEEIETQDLELVITGPLGKRKVLFSGLQVN